MPKNFKGGGQSWYYALASGKRDRILIDFPLHLWGEVGSWWSRLSWSDRQPGLLRGVTWLELLADFELTTGVNCIRPRMQSRTRGDSEPSYSVMLSNKSYE